MSSVRTDTLDGTTDTLRADKSDCSKDASWTPLLVALAASGVRMTMRTRTLLPCSSSSTASACGNCASKASVSRANSRTFDEASPRLECPALAAALDSFDETSLRLSSRSPSRTSSKDTTG